MKHLPYILLLFIGSILAVQSQVKVFSGGTEITNGQGTDQQSKAFEMKGPYLLRWHLLDVPPSKADDPYWKPRTNTDRNPPWISVRVYDASTQQVIASASLDGRENQMAVKQGGKHYLVISSYNDLKWTVWGKEGIMEANGVRQLTAADTGGGTAESARDALIEQLTESQTSKLQEKIAAAKLVASRSNSAKDFNERWKAYSAAQGW